MKIISPKTERAINAKSTILTGLFAGVIGGASGLLWNGDLSSLMIVALVPPVGLSFSKGPSAVFFLFYFISAIRSVPVFYPIFYAGSTPFSGLPIWLAWGVGLALPWILARCFHSSRVGVTIPVQLLIGYLPPFLPPFWFLGAGSPLFPAGILFPGLGFSGLLLLVVYQGTLLAFFKTRSMFFLPVLLFFVLISGFSHRFIHEKSLPPGWTAIDTSNEPRPLLQRPPWENKVANRVLAALDSGARVVLLPEGIASFWTKDAVCRISLPYPWNVVDQEARDRGVTVLIGSEIPRDSGQHIWDDDLIALGEGGIRVFPARQPIPVAGWNPFSKTHHEPAHWGKSGMIRIDGQRAYLSICFEDLLIGAHVEAMLFGRPEVVFSADNLWFSKGTSDRGFQSESIRSFGRLFGIPVLRAVNQ